MGVAAKEVEVAEVELPDVAEGAAGAEVGQAAGGVGEGEAELHDVEGVDVQLQELVALRRGEAAGVDVGGMDVDSAWVFGVEGGEAEAAAADDGADQRELVVGVLRPHLPHLHHPSRHGKFDVRT